MATFDTLPSIMLQKLKFEPIKNEVRTSFRYLYSSLPYRDEISLHFHPELEITYIKKGAGYRMAGDFLEAFSEGEVVLLPSNLPHCWIYNPESCGPEGNRECMCVQFLPSLLRDGMAFFAEWGYAAHRLMTLQQGMRITGNTAGKVISILGKMRTQDESERLLGLLRIVQLVGTTAEITPIGTQNEGFAGISKNMRRIQLVFKYVVEQYREKITLSDIASYVNMSPTAFCAFFKEETGQTFSSFVNEYRIGIVCNLLRNYPDREICEIAWQCGFTDIPYFNRYFKKVKKVTPREWKKGTP